MRRLKDYVAQDVLGIARESLKAAGLGDVLAQLIPENLVGDDDARCEGYVQLDSYIDIYPELVGDRVGWGVSHGVCTPGIRTLPNGDPGYPDEYDVADVLSPSFTTPGINGTLTHARAPGDAVDAAIVLMVSQRLKDFRESQSIDLMLEEQTND